MLLPISEAAFTCMFNTVFKNKTVQQPFQHFSTCSFLVYFPNHYAESCHYQYSLGQAFAVSKYIVQVYVPKSLFAVKSKSRKNIALSHLCIMMPVDPILLT